MNDIETPQHEIIVVSRFYKEAASVCSCSYRRELTDHHS